MIKYKKILFGILRLRVRIKGKINLEEDFFFKFGVLIKVWFNLLDVREIYRCF